jgi:Fe-Mn family superoxide dismutase
MPSQTQYEAKPLPFAKDLVGISKKTMEIHHDKLYVGYVNKMREISEKLKAMAQTGAGLDAANQTYSELRALRDGETFATNGVYLHEYYFNVLGGDGKPTGALVKAIEEKWGALEKFVAFFSATGMAVRGWVVLAWDAHIGRLKIYGSDAHNQGGVWGCIPIIVLDVYEHAYFIDYGSDRKAYIQDFWKNLNWDAANHVFEKATKLTLNS